jgi:hypothetical protein
MPAPQIGDSSNNLLAKILQNLGGTPSVGDGKLNLLRKIAEAYGATTNRSDSSWMLLSRIVATGANKPSVSDSEYNLLYKFALNTGVSPFRGDGKYNILYRICQQTIPPVYDEDAVAFAEASGATDIANLSAFVTGVKDLGLWDSMVCWPLRSSQNAGTGTTAYSLGGLGTYNGTLVNGPTWGVDGVDFSAASTQSISTSLIAQVGASGGVYNTTSGLNQSILSNRNDPIWVNGTTLNARADGSDSVAFVDIGGSASRIRATGSPIFEEYVFTQATHTLAGTAVTGDTTFRQNKNARSSGAYVLGSGAMGAADTTLRIGAEQPGSANAFNGTIAFAFISESIFSSQTQDSLFDLYKSTLGQGLGLP